MKRLSITLIFFSVFFTITSCKKSFSDNNAPGGENEISRTSTDTKPNIVLILGDDIGYEVPTCDNGGSYQTPNIDLLAKQGTRFTQCHASPLCSPSRFMLQTGKYNFRNYFKWGSLPLTEKTMGNLMKKAGYQTCIVGKWQFGGGDAEIRQFGYNAYCLTDTRDAVNEEDEQYSRYKNPTIYQNGDYLSADSVQGKYSEDFFSQYLTNFIQHNKQKPFFAVYSLALAHRPFCPTPKDVEFKGWDPTQKISDNRFFPSMVSYMDDEVGLVMRTLKRYNLDDNTIVIYTGDNGTPGNPNGIYSLYNGKLILGGKGTTKEYGTHVPLIVKWPGKVAAGKLNNSLVDFTDFLPTLADIVNVQVPAGYGTIDGKSFYAQLLGSETGQRSYIYNYFNPHPDRRNALVEWIQTDHYKLYTSGLFYDINHDVKEKSPLDVNALTPFQKGVKERLAKTLLNMRH